MLELTRLNGSRLAVNADLIKYAESSPDTVLTLVTGEKLIVRESRTEVMLRSLMHRAAVLREAWPEAATALTAVNSRLMEQASALAQEENSNL